MRSTGKTSSSDAGDLLWAPPPDVREHSRLGHYLRWLEEHRGLTFDGYPDLWEWSVTDLEAFWTSIWEYFEVGPPVMSRLFGQHFHYNRFGLALIGLGMGFHLTAGALNQAALARNHARAAAACWIVSAAVFVAWMLSHAVADQVLRAEIGYTGATGLLALSLAALYRRGSAERLGARAARPAPGTAA